VLCALLPLPAALALLLGIACAACGVRPARAHALGQWLLKASLVALGAGMDLGVVLRTGLEGLGATALTLGAALVLGLALGRRLGLSRDLTLLVTVGTAICGGSAIAAAAPVLRARAADVAVALGVVFAWNALALVVFPPLARMLALDPATYGRWCALAIHDTSSVVGAAAGQGALALETATVTKLARTLWIVPVCLALAWATRGRGEAGTRRVRVPLFLLGFVLAAAVVTLFPVLEPFGARLAHLARGGLRAALFTLGLGFTREGLSSLGARPLWLGAGLWVGLSGVSLLALVAA